MTERIAINQIRTDGGTQPRAGLDEATVTEYTEAVKRGDNFPPVILFYDGAAYWLADGFHRHAAHKAAKKQRITAEVRQGTLRDAILHAVGANATHGLRRSNEDKRRAVKRLLDDPEWAEWSDREIAKHCKVSHPFVAKLRPVTGNVSSENRKYTTKHGTQATMNTAKIGKDNLKAVIDTYLRQFYATDDVAVLASIARYRNATTEKHHLHGDLRKHLEKKGIHASHSLIASASQELAISYQDGVPAVEKKEMPSGDFSSIANALRLVEVISRMPDDNKLALRYTFTQNLKQVTNNAKPFYGLLMELLT